MANFVTLGDLAGELGMDKSNLRKYVIDRKMTFTKIRAGGKGQSVLALSEEDANTIRQLRESEGYAKRLGSTPVTEMGYGSFYIIQVVPELSAERVKLGYASSLESRLAAHRTTCPTAVLIKSWLCKAAWEQAALASVTRVGCTLIGGEVYVCDSIDDLILRADQFFSIMPSM